MTKEGIYGLSWGIGFGAGGMAGPPELSVRWMVTLVVVCALATLGEALAVRIFAADKVEDRAP